MSSGKRAAIRFGATLEAIDRWTLLRLPEKASRQLPSRGQVAAEATINGHRVDLVVEPDGHAGHWVKVGKRELEIAGLKAGDTVELEIQPVDEWPEARVPPDLRAALEGAPPHIRELWTDITPMARWEWVRWVNATRNPETRRRRVEVSISKMRSGKRRPCCFNLASCTDPDLSRSGKLVEPAT